MNERTLDATPPATGSSLVSRWWARTDIRLVALLIVLIGLCVVGYITRPDAFLTEGNISTVLRLAAAIGVVSVGMTFVISAGGIDLSVGSMVALSSVWMTTWATQSYGVGAMVVCALLVGTGCGLVNGLLVAYGRWCRSSRRWP